VGTAFKVFKFVVSTFSRIASYSVSTYSENEQFTRAEVYFVSFPKNLKLNLLMKSLNAFNIPISFVLQFRFWP